MLFQITYASHAGAYTLAEMFEVIKPKRIHPMIQNELIENEISKIPDDILNDGCEIINDLGQSLGLQDVTLDDLTEHGQDEGSFLQMPKTISGTMPGEISDVIFDDDNDVIYISSDSSNSSHSSDSQPNYPDYWIRFNWYLDSAVIILNKDFYSNSSFKTL